MSSQTDPNYKADVSPAKAQINFTMMLSYLEGDRESLCMLLDIFIKDHYNDPEKIARLQAQSLPDAIRVAHSLKSVGGNLGAAKLKEVAHQLEAALSQHDEKVPLLLEELERCLEQAIKEAKAFIAET